MASKAKKTTVAIYIMGGVVQDTKANHEGVEIILFDVDDLKAEGVSSKKIDERWDKIVDNCHWDTDED